MGDKSSALEILRILEQGFYEVDGKVVPIAEEQSRAVSNTCLYTPDALTSIPQVGGCKPSVKVVEGTTQIVAHAMSLESQDVVTLLNFASARNPGGGFLNGAKAQEEDLCRCSGLYPCLLTCPEYYNSNRNQTSLLYTDHAIFSPSVPFLRLSGKSPWLAEPFFASVITAPAPNTGPYLRENPTGLEILSETFVRRWKNVLRIARDRGTKRLLLGAWGCGAFQGDPVLASRTAQEAIESDGSGLNEIVFAIPTGDQKSRSNWAAFRRTFA